MTFLPANETRPIQLPHQATAPQPGMFHGGPPGLDGVVCHSKRANENLRAIVLRKKMNQNDSK